MRFQKIIANETRLKMLLFLNDRPRTWTEMMFGLEINPKVLRDHLRILSENDLIRRGEDNSYEITDAGRALVSMSLKAMVKVSDWARKTRSNQTDA